MSRNPEKGAAELLGMLVALAVLMIMFAAAVPDILAVKRAQNSTDVRTFMTTASRANAAAAICGMQSGCVSSPDVLGAIPNAGSFAMSGYEITTTVAPFSITATSTGDLYSAPLNMFIGNDGILRCSNDLALPATAATSPCQ